MKPEPLKGKECRLYIKDISKGYGKMVNISDVLSAKEWAINEIKRNYGSNTPHKKYINPLVSKFINIIEKAFGGKI